MGKAGRPSDYTEQLAEEICERLANSDVSLRQLCAKPGMPNDRTVRRWLVEHEGFARKYARARELQADVIFEDMGEVEQRVSARKMAPDAGRVVLWSKQWRAAKLASKKYGDRLAVDHGVQDNLADALRAARERAAEG